MTNVARDSGLVFRISFVILVSDFVSFLGHFTMTHPTTIKTGSRIGMEKRIM